MIPGWPYSVVAALQTGRSSWTAVLDAIRLGPTDDATTVTAAQLREVVDRLREAGHWRAGDPDIWIVLDSGYDVARLTFLLADLPVQLIGRLRSDRVLARPVAPPVPAPGAARPATARSWRWPTRIPRRAGPRSRPRGKCDQGRWRSPFPAFPTHGSLLGGRGRSDESNGTGHGDRRRCCR